MCGGGGGGGSVGVPEVSGPPVSGHNKNKNVFLFFSSNTSDNSLLCW